MKRLGRYFLQGLIFVAPIAVTLFVFYKVFVMIDEPVRSMMKRLIGVSVPGAGFGATMVIAVVVLTLVGFLSSNMITRSMMRFVERQFERFPLVKLIHSSIRDLIGAFVGDRKKFDRPVAVKLSPGGGVKLLGFVTRSDMTAWGERGLVAVYLPQSYNFAGNVVLVPPEQVEPLRAGSGEVMTFIVSGGVSGGTPST